MSDPRADAACSSSGRRSPDSVLRDVWATLRLAARTDRATLVVLAVAQVVDAVAVVAGAYVAKHVVDAVVTASRSATHDRLIEPVVWVGVEFVVLSLAVIATHVTELCTVVLRHKVGLQANLLLLDRCANVSYPRFEEPEFVNRLALVRGEVGPRSAAVVGQTLRLARNAMVVVGSAALVLTVGPWAFVALAAVASLNVVAEVRHARAIYTLRRARSQRSRTLSYLESVLTTEDSVKEVKLFGLSQWLMRRYRDIYLGYFYEERALVGPHRRRLAVLEVLAQLGLGIAYAWLAVSAARGAITLGTLTLSIMAFRQQHQSLKAAATAMTTAYEDSLFMAPYFEHLRTEPDEPDESFDPSISPLAEAPVITFDKVSFHYPGVERAVLDDVSLTIQAGETVALVGRSGAGKTTLIKLLVGLYRPTSGRILIGGVDTATMSRAVLRHSIGVIFQDFVKYQLSVRDNVGVGWLAALHDDEAVRAATTSAGITDALDGLPDGLDTPLGRASDGAELSGGQWQRLALARAFVRCSRVLVLDEPTAAVDAETEHEIFQRFRDLKANRTAVLITHRFSTVRMADRVVVFEKGAIIEEGTHRELMALGGRYAAMFRLQADGYRD
jgi:ATP-binding cassette subfamily B protein